MQTPPPTPPPTVAPGAPRRPLLIRRSKTTPALSAEDKAALMPQLKAIRAKHAPRVLELTRVALDALNALEQLEGATDEEARALYPSYVRDIEDCPSRLSASAIALRAHRVLTAGPDPSPIPRHSRSAA